VLGQYDELVGYASKSSGGKVVKAADISAHVTSLGFSRAWLGRPPMVA
jgi:hypothetical protein